MPLIILLFCLTVFCIYFFVSLAKHQSTQKHNSIEEELIPLKNGWKVVQLKDPSLSEYMDGPFYKRTRRIGINLGPMFPGFQPTIFIADLKRGEKTREAWIRINRVFGITTSVDIVWSSPGHTLKGPNDDLTGEEWERLL